MRKRMIRMLAVLLSTTMLLGTQSMAVLATDVSEPTVEATTADSEAGTSDTVAQTENGTDASDTSEVSVSEDTASNLTEAQDETKTQQNAQTEDHGTEATDEQAKEADAAADPEADESKTDAPEEVITTYVDRVDEIISAYALSATVFDDVNADAWYLSYATYVLNKGLMTGVGNNRFEGSQSLSRAQFVTVLYRISGSPDMAYRNTYPDVPENSFYTSAVMWASQDGVNVVSGYEDGRFGASDFITREQMATMLYRYAEYRKFETTKGKLDHFPDASSVSTFAKDAMAWAVGHGIITGDQGTLNPQGITSRGVCATMIERFCEQFMPGELPDVTYSASSSSVEMYMIDNEAGTFWVKVNGLTGSHAINKVEIPVWCADDQSDLVWYQAEKQNDGTWGVLVETKNHGYRSGTYKADIYALLSCGLRMQAGSSSLDVTVSEAKARVMGHVNNVYNQAGRDLNACYWWVVNNVSYYTLPIPLNPPAGYTSDEWYSIWGFEQRKGNCYVFAATFYQLAKNLGYDVEFIQGQVGMAAGGLGPHGWVVVHLNGASYICDPESQRDIGRYNFYMQPVGNTVLQYYW